MLLGGTSADARDVICRLTQQHGHSVSNDIENQLIRESVFEKTSVDRILKIVYGLVWVRRAKNEILLEISLNCLRAEKIQLSAKKAKSKRS